MGALNPREEPCVPWASSGWGPMSQQPQDSPVHPSADGASSCVGREEEPRQGRCQHLCAAAKGFSHSCVCFEDLASKKA